MFVHWIPSPLGSVMHPANGMQFAESICFQFGTGLVGAWRNRLLESVRGSGLLESQHVSDENLLFLGTSSPVPYKDLMWYCTTSQAVA